MIVPDSLHPPVPAPRHHPTILENINFATLWCKTDFYLLIGSDLVTCQTNLSSPGDPLALCDVGSHSLALRVQEVIMEKRKTRRMSKSSHLSFEQLCARVTDVLLAQLNLQKTFMAKALKTLSLKVKNSAKG